MFLINLIKYLICGTRNISISFLRNLEFRDKEQSSTRQRHFRSRKQNDTRIVRKTGRVIFLDCSGTKYRDQLSLKELFSVKKFLLLLDRSREIVVKVKILSIRSYFKVEMTSNRNLKTTV